MDVLRHRVAITAEAGGKTSETVIQKIFDELPGPGGEGRINLCRNASLCWPMILIVRQLDKTEMADMLRWYLKIAWCR